MKLDRNGKPIRKNNTVRYQGGSWDGRVGVVHEVSNAHGRNSGINTVDAIEVKFPDSDHIALVSRTNLEVIDA